LEIRNKFNKNNNDNEFDSILNIKTGVENNIRDKNANFIDEENKALLA
jgi:hypothetical protein